MAQKRRVGFFDLFPMVDTRFQTKNIGLRRKPFDPQRKDRGLTSTNIKALCYSFVGLMVV